MEQPLISVILPFYKQSDHMQAVLDDYEAALRRESFSFEIIIVVNGEAGLAEERQVKALRASPRMVEVRMRKAGWGRALKEGFALAQGHFICYTNTARTEVNEFVKLIRYALISDDVVVKATRVVRNNWLRKWTSKLYNIENRILLQAPVWDVNATPKIIPKHLLDHIPLADPGNLFDAELMHKCYRRQIPIIEIPIHHSERRSGKSTTNIVSAVLMLIGLFRVRFDPAYADLLSKTDNEDPAVSHVRSKARMTPRERVITLITSLVFGAVSVIPNLWLRADAGTAFQGVEIQGTDQEYLYAARVREIYDGSLRASNVYYAGNKDQPYLQPPLPELVIATVGRLAWVDAARALLLSKFMLGAILWYVMAGFFTALSRRWDASFLAVAALTFAGPMFSGPWAASQLIQGTAGQLEFLPFSRPVNPQWSGLLFFGALWALLVWSRTKSLRSLVLTGVITVASVYSYVYTWTMLGVIYVIHGIYALLRRNRRSIAHVALLFLIVVVGSAPYLWNMWKAVHHPAYPDATKLFGMIASHRPVAGLTLIALLAIAWFGRKGFGDRAFMVFSLAVAAVVVLNQQIVTGQHMVSAHYHWYYIKPLAIILFIIPVWTWIRDRATRGRITHERLLTSVWCAVIFLSVAFGVLYQRTSYVSARSLWLNMQQAGPTLTYLDRNFKAGDVVYARDFIRELVPIYTSADVYWATNAPIFLSGDRRSRDTYFFDLWVDGVSADQAAAAFPAERRAELSSRIHGIYYREAAGGYRNIPDAEVEDAVAAYRAYMSLTDEERFRLYPFTVAALKAGLPETPAIVAIKRHGVRVYGDDAYEVIRLARTVDE